MSVRVGSESGSFECVCSVGVGRIPWESSTFSRCWIECLLSELTESGVEVCAAGIEN